MIREYIEKLIELVEIEQEAEINAMMSEIRRLSAYEREKAGRAINNLNGKKTKKELGYQIVKYGRDTNIETEILVGDLVLISKGNPFKSDLTGIVTEKGRKYISISIENVPKWALKNIRIDLYSNDVTFRRMLDNLKKLSHQGKRALRYFLIDEQLDSHLDDDELFFDDVNLNDSQKWAVKRAVSSDDFFLIHGPFGTGKTRTLIEVIKQEVKQDNKVLVTSESNVAVDNLLSGLIRESDMNFREGKKYQCTRIGHPHRASRENIKQTLAYKVENHPLQYKIRDIDDEVKKLIEERSLYIKPVPQYRRGHSNNEILIKAHKKQGSRGISPNVMMSMGKWLKINERIVNTRGRVHEIEKIIVWDILNKSQVIICTNSSVGLDILEEFIFDVAVIDEASQTTIPSVLLPISKARRFVLAGDHRQLPPTIISHKAKELNNTLFEGLIAKFRDKSSILNIQYRMGDELMEFPNMEFYDGRIKSAGMLVTSDEGYDVLRDSLDSDVLLDPIYFCDTKDYENHFENQFSDSTSKFNKLEADLLTQTLFKLLTHGFTYKQIGIISPYVDQVAYIKDIITKNLGINCTEKIEIKSVDGFQGREKDIIIMSLVRSNKKQEIGFLNDLRRFNVSITRGRKNIIIIADSTTLKSNPTYHRFIKYIKNNNYYHTKI